MAVRSRTGDHGAWEEDSEVAATPRLARPDSTAQAVDSAVLRLDLVDSVAADFRVVDREVLADSVAVVTSVEEAGEASTVEAAIFVEDEVGFVADKAAGAMEAVVVASAINLMASRARLQMVHQLAREAIVLVAEASVAVVAHLMTGAHIAAQAAATTNPWDLEGAVVEVEVEVTATQTGRAVGMAEAETATIHESDATMAMATTTGEISQGTEVRLRVGVGKEREGAALLFFCRGFASAFVLLHLLLPWLSISGSGAAKTG